MNSETEGRNHIYKSGLYPAHNQRKSQPVTRNTQGFVISSSNNYPESSTATSATKRGTKQNRKVVPKNMDKMLSSSKMRQNNIVKKAFMVHEEAQGGKRFIKSKTPKQYRSNQKIYRDRERQVSNNIPHEIQTNEDITHSYQLTHSAKNQISQYRPNTPPILQPNQIMAVSTKKPDRMNFQQLNDRNYKSFQEIQPLNAVPSSKQSIYATTNHTHGFLHQSSKYMNSTKDMPMSMKESMKDDDSIQDDQEGFEFQGRRTSNFKSNRMIDQHLYSRQELLPQQA